MIDDRYIPLVIDYLEGQLSAQGELELQQLLQTGELNKEELQEYRKLLYQIEALPDPEPSPALRTNFYSMLAQAEAQEKRPDHQPNILQSIRLWLQQFFWTGKVQAGMVFSGALLLLIGVGLGYWLKPVQVYEQQIAQLQNKVVEMQQVAMLSQLQQSSASERLLAVNMSQELPSADEQVIKALLHTLNADQSVNVRLAAIEALHRHAGNSIVREGLIRSLERQESPLVLVALADVMVSLQEKGAVAPMQKLLEQKELDSTVKQQINQSIQTLL